MVAGSQEAGLNAGTYSSDVMGVLYAGFENWRSLSRLAVAENFDDGVEGKKKKKKRKKRWKSRLSRPGYCAQTMHMR